jgi:uncharacterized protein YjlB
MIAMTQPEAVLFEDDGSIPNNPLLPCLIYRRVVDLADSKSPGNTVENLFARNGWRDVWWNGIYAFVHYHSRIHEVLGVARGHAQVRLGGRSGRELEFAAGDVAVLPAGTGHQCLSASDDLLVIGAYAPGGEYDLCRGSAEERTRALESIPTVPLPKSDPVFGRIGPLLRLWKR